MSCEKIREDLHAIAKKLPLGIDQAYVYSVRSGLVEFCSKNPTTHSRNLHRALGLGITVRELKKMDAMAHSGYMDEAMLITTRFEVLIQIYSQQKKEAKTSEL